MAQYDELTGLLRELLTNKFSPKPRYINGLLGDGLGNVVVPDRPDKVYARFSKESTTYFEIFNVTVPKVNNWPVKIGELPWNPGLTQVVGTNWSAFEQAGWGDVLGSTSPHAPTHEWPDGAPGSDVVSVFTRAIVPGRAFVTPGAPTTIYVNSFEYGTTGTLWPGLPGVDLQPVMSATVTGTMRYAGVYVDEDTNSLGVVTGGTTVYTSALEPPRVSFPATGVIPIARVRVYGGQAGLVEADIKDARRLWGTGGGDGGTGGGWPFDKILTVSSTNSNATYSTIQAAINDIPEFGSGLLVLDAETFTENLTITNRRVSIVTISRNFEPTLTARITGTITIEQSSNNSGAFTRMAVIFNRVVIGGAVSVDSSVMVSGAGVNFYLDESSIGTNGSPCLTLNSTGDGQTQAYATESSLFNADAGAGQYEVDVNGASDFNAVRSIIERIDVDTNASVSIEHPMGITPVVSGSGSIASLDRLLGTPVAYLAQSSWQPGDVVKYAGPHWEVGPPSSDVAIINPVINGAFQVWQRGTSFAAVANGTYTADRWGYGKTGAMVHTIARSTDVPTVAEAGVLAPYSLLIDCTTVDSSIAAGDHCLLLTRIEGYNFANLAQRQFTLSFWVKATRTGIYCVSFSNSGGDRSYVAEYTIAAGQSGTWLHKTITVSASPAAGTWDYTNGRGLQVAFALAAGSTFQTTADTWQTGNYFATSSQDNLCDNTANDFYLALVDVTPGPAAPVPVIPDIQQEITRCQRYFEKSYAMATDPGTNTTTNCEQNLAGNAVSASAAGFSRNCFSNFQVVKRDAPVMVIYATDGTANAVTLANLPANRTGATASLQSEKRMPQIGYDNTSGQAITVGDIVRWHYTASAEL